MTEKKKSSFGRTIFKLILLIVLILGGYFGYQYYLDQNRVTYHFNGEFPIEGTWYVNDNGEAFSDNALNFAEYKFSEPTKEGDRYIGRVYAIHFQDSNYTHTGDYEITGDNKIKVSFPGEMDYDFTYNYYPDEQKLEMSFAGQERTLVREKPVVQESTPVAEAENPEQIETHEKLDKISNHEWINQMNNLVIFGKPKKEGDIYTGEYIVYYDEFSDIFKYEILEDGLWKIIGIKKLYKDGTEKPYVHESNYNLQMDEEGKTLVLKNHEATYVLRRK